MKPFIFCCLLIIYASYCLAQSRVYPPSNYRSEMDYTNLLLEKDSIIHKKKMLERSIEASLLTKDFLAAAVGYDAIGSLFEKLGNYEISKEYYTKSLNYLGDSNELRTSLVQHKLLNIYIKGKNYTSFDSLYPIAQQLSRKLHTENTLKNYLLKVSKYFELQHFDSMYHFTEEIIPAVRSTEIGKLKYSEKLDYKDFKKLLLYQLRLYNGLSKIKNPSAEIRDSGYKIFLALSVDSLKKSFIVTDEAIYSLHRIRSVLLNYQAKYYLQRGVFDSAATLYAKADNEKYLAIREYERRLTVDGHLLYQAAKAEDEIAYEAEMLQKERRLLNAYRLMAAGTLIACIILSVFLIYYSKSQKKIKLINNELVRKNEVLLNHDEERKHFFELVSHELRTPVYGINGLAAMIEAEDNADKKDQYFSSLKIIVQYVSMLIDNMLQENRFSFKARKLNPTPVNISAQIENIYKSMQIFAKEKSIELQYRSAINSKSLVLLDRVILNQVMINLIYNAIKYSNYGSTVSFEILETSLRSDNVQLQFDIKDEGRGLNYVEDISEFKVYEPQKNLKHSQSGSGLGLTIVQQLLRCYNAHLFVKSDRDKGTHFRFTLLLPTDDTLERLRSKSTHAEKVTLEKKVLIVDDNPLNLLITRKTIEKTFPSVKATTADSGAKAVELYKYINFDLVLMDINMPEMSGFETTLKLKSVNKQVLVVALTALSYHNVIDKAQEVGMEDVITKPYTIEVFEKTISHYLNRKPGA